MKSNLLRENSTLLLFSSFEFSYRFSFGIFLPFYSLILLAAGWSTKNITYFFAAAAIVIFLTGPMIGKISDEFGKKRIIKLGIFFALSSSLLHYFFLSNVIIAFFVRIIEVVGFVCISYVSLGAFEDTIKAKRGFFTGILLGIGTLGTFLGPLVAAFLVKYFEYRILLLFPIPLLILAFIVLHYLPEHSKQKKSTKVSLNPLSEITHFIKNIKLRGVGFLGILMNSKVQIYGIFFPILIVKELGFSEQALGLLLTIPVTAHLFQFYFGKIKDTISGEFGVLLGVLISSVSLFFLPYVSGFFEILILLLIFGIGTSIWNVNAWSLMGEIAKKENMEGEVVGTYMSVGKIGVFISTLLSASLVTFFGIVHTIQIFAILVMFGVIVSYFMFKPIFHPEKKPSYFHLLK